MAFNNAIVAVTAGQVQFPTRVKVGVTVKNLNEEPGQPPTLNADLETYSGFIELNQSAGEGTNGDPDRFTCRSFLLIDTTSNARAYERVTLLDIATNVSLAATSPNNAHVAVTAIDAAQTN